MQAVPPARAKGRTANIDVYHFQRQSWFRRAKTRNGSFQNTIQLRFGPVTQRFAINSCLLYNKNINSKSKIQKREVYVFLDYYFKSLKFNMCNLERCLNDLCLFSACCSHYLEHLSSKSTFCSLPLKHVHQNLSYKEKQIRSNELCLFFIEIKYSRENQLYFFLPFLHPYPYTYPR